MFGGGGGGFGVPVTVSPQSSTDARSGAGGGVGDHNFYIGGNPNIAAAFGGGNNTWLLLGLGALALFLLLRRR